jgi:hypothetical protein
MLAELKESLPSFFRQSAAYRELEQQAAERVEQQRADALAQLAECGIRHSAEVLPLQDVIDDAAGAVKAAEQALLDARQALQRAFSAKQAAGWPIDRERSRLTALLEGELCDQRITDAVEQVEADCQTLMNHTVAADRNESSAAKYRAITARLQHLRHTTKPALLALRTQRVEDVSKAIAKLLKAAPEA